MERGGTNGNNVKGTGPIPNFENAFARFRSKLRESGSNVSELQLTEQIWVNEKETLLKTIREKETLHKRMEGIISALQDKEKIWIGEKEELTTKLRNTAKELEGSRSEISDLKGRVSSMEDALWKERNKSRKLEDNGRMLQMAKDGFQEFKDSADKFLKRMETLEKSSDEGQAGRGQWEENRGDDNGDVLETEQSILDNGDGHISVSIQTNGDSPDGLELQSTGTSNQTHTVFKTKSATTTNSSNYDDPDLGNVSNSTELAKKARIGIVPRLVLISSLESYVEKASHAVLLKSGYNLRSHDSNRFIDDRNANDDDDNLQDELQSNEEESRHDSASVLFPNHDHKSKYEVNDDHSNVTDAQNYQLNRASSATANDIAKGDSNQIIPSLASNKSLSNANCFDASSNGSSTNVQTGSAPLAHSSATVNNTHDATNRVSPVTNGRKRCTVIGCEKLISIPSYKRHMNTHSNIKPFKCSICDKSFGDKSNFRRHKLAHGLEGLFECMFCHKVYKYKTNLYNHIKTCNSKEM